MGFALADRVRETSTTTGLGALTLAGALPSFRTFGATYATGDTAYLAIVNRDVANEWEISLCTKQADGTWTRGAVLSGTNGAATVNFSAGTKDVTVAYPAAKAVVHDPNGDVAITRNIAVGGTLNVVAGTTGFAMGDVPGRRRIVTSGATFVFLTDANGYASAQIGAIAAAGNIYPAADNATDLGISGTNRFRHLFLYGDVYSASLGVADFGAFVAHAQPFAHSASKTALAGSGTGQGQWWSWGPNTGSVGTFAWIDRSSDGSVGSTRMLLNLSGLGIETGLYALTDNTYDVGAVSSVRFRDLYLARKIQALSNAVAIEYANDAVSPRLQSYLSRTLYINEIGNPVTIGSSGVPTVTTMWGDLGVTRTMLVGGAPPTFGYIRLWAGGTTVADAATSYAASMFIGGFLQPVHATGDSLLGFSNNVTFDRQGATSLQTFGFRSSPAVTGSGTIVGHYHYYADATSFATVRYAFYSAGDPSIFADVRALTDNAYDLGSSGANRFRNLYLAKDIWLIQAFSASAGRIRWGTNTSTGALIYSPFAASLYFKNGDESADADLYAGTISASKDLYGANGQARVQWKSTSAVGAGATAITPHVTNAMSGLVMVGGAKNDFTNNRFSELVWFSAANAGGPGIVQVIAGTTLNEGAPAARTYSITGDQLTLSMASGAYDIYATLWAGGFFPH